ncbi:unnamed protein product [Orchesella dallaii]|uniref:C2H2-type domain-containing protein n=1 Tax=Orchesella dallaii TaxID=48710 RepID=A0ABP1PWC6_9HEXA
MRIEWNNCFLCLNDLKSLRSPQGGKKRGRRKKVYPKVLLKYLLEACGSSSGRERYDKVLKDILQLIGSEDGLIPAASPIQLCAKCEIIALQISNLHRELEVVQMKLADRVKSVREVVISNSKLYGKNEVAKMCLKVFEDWLNEQGDLGMGHVKEKRILKVLYAFQTAVYETDKGNNDVPLIFVKKISEENLPAAAKQFEAFLDEVKMEPGDIDFPEGTIPDSIPESIDDDDDWCHPITPCSFSSSNDSTMDKIVSESKSGSESSTSIPKPRAKRKGKSSTVRLTKKSVKPSGSDVSMNSLDGSTQLSVTKDVSSDEETKDNEEAETESSNQVRKNLEGGKWRVKNIINWARDNNRILPSTNTHNEITNTNFNHLKSKKTPEKQKKIRGPYKKIPSRKERSRFECQLCSWKIKNIYRFEQHLRDHETEDKGYTCDKCSKKFSGEQLYEFHQECHAGKHKILCEYCNLKFPPLTIEDHMKTHSEKVFPCNNCSYCCLTRDKLIEHLRKHCSSVINCDVCAVPIKTRQKLLEHLHQEHCVIEKVQCNFGNCKKSFLDPYNLWVHKNIHNKQFPCPLCEKTFTGDAQRKIHLRYHNGERPFACDQCSERFPSKSNLERHMISQHGAPKHKCEYCLKEYADRSQYLAHVRLHEGGGFNCEVCNKAFGSERDLRKHLVVHRTESNFVCEECGKAFRRPESLKKHKMIHTGDKKFKCTYCSKAFVFQKYLVQHLRIHTGERPYVCDYCGKNFNQYGALYTHKKIHLSSAPSPAEPPVNQDVEIGNIENQDDLIMPEPSAEPLSSSLMPTDFTSEMNCGYINEEILIFVPITETEQFEPDTESGDFENSSPPV